MPLKYFFFFSLFFFILMAVVIFILKNQLVLNILVHFLNWISLYRIVSLKKSALFFEAFYVSFCILKRTF